MKLLHTSDWHLGRALYGRKRYEEFEAFLNWLREIIQTEAVDILLVAGDIFDTTTPSNRAQNLYYDFLTDIADSSCRHVVVIGGNHDSASFLDAPLGLLRRLNVQVVGSARENPADEVFLLEDQSGQPMAVVCAVPYLRDRDIRTVEAGESLADKEQKLIEGLKQHYAEVGRIAEEKRAQAGDIPIIGMGHLFTAGGKTVDGDGVRELYVGSLAHVGQNVFPDCFDYLALGHLHVPQAVAGVPHIRYSGSPIPMGFGEAQQEKKVVLVDFSGSGQPKIEEKPIPCFQPLKRIVGDLSHITGQIQQLTEASSNAWLEIEYTGADIAADLRGVVEEAVNGSAMEIRRIKNRRVVDRVAQQTHQGETLDDLNEEQVFTRCLDAHEVPEEQRPPLILAYQEILQSLQQAEPET